jgi:hypothetical protein
MQPLQVHCHDPAVKLQLLKIPFSARYAIEPALTLELELASEFEFLWDTLS